MFNICTIFIDFGFWTALVDLNDITVVKQIYDSDNVFTFYDLMYEKLKIFVFYKSGGPRVFCNELIGTCT